MKGRFVQVFSDKELTNEQGKRRDINTVLSKSPTTKKQIDSMLDGVERELEMLRLQEDLKMAAYNLVMWERRLARLIAESRETCS